jgi:transcriptional/translational regulatory protein YebC/TACO1
MSKEISSSVREGGGDPDINFKLRLIIEKAKKLNIPKKVIEYAISAGLGKNGKDFISYQFSGYGIGKL